MRFALVFLEIAMFFSILLLAIGFLNIFHVLIIAEKKSIFGDCVFPCAALLYF